jgi:hypothetical protein
MSAGTEDGSTGAPDAPMRMPAPVADDASGEGPGLAPAMADDGLGDGDGGELAPIGRLGAIEIVGAGRVGVGTGGLGNGGRVRIGGSVGGVIVGSGKGGGVGKRTVGTGSGGKVGRGRLGTGVGRLGSAAGKKGSGSGPMAATGRATSNTAPRTAVTTRMLPPRSPSFRGRARGAL